MNWFEEQILKRKENDDRFLDNTFVQAAGIVYGQKTANDLLDESIITEHAIDEILKFYHLKPVEVPDHITDGREQLDYCLRHYGLMKRRIILQKNWFEDACGVMLTYRKVNGEPVVLLPDKLGRHYRFKDSTGKMVKVNRRTALLFEERSRLWTKKSLSASRAWATECA